MGPKSFPPEKDRPSKTSGRIGGKAPAHTILDLSAFGIAPHTPTTPVSVSPAPVGSHVSEGGGNHPHLGLHGHWEPIDESREPHARNWAKPPRDGAGTKASMGVPDDVPSWAIEGYLAAQESPGRRALNSLLYPAVVAFFAVFLTALGLLASWWLR